MNIKNLGIYLSREKAVAAVTAVNDGVLNVSECFTVTMQAKADQDCPTLAAQIAAELASRGVEIESVSIALDCTLYTQHDIHSSFADYRQIAQTVRFDAEEVLGDDANRMAIAFSIVKPEDNGSTITVFSAIKDELAKILSDFQSQKLDPEVIEPDVVAFARAVSFEMADNSEISPIFVAFNDKVCYNAVMNSPHSKPVLRSFLYIDSLDKTEVLLRQLKLTLARNTITVPVDTLCVFNKDVDRELLLQKSGLSVPDTVDMLKPGSSLFAVGDAADMAKAVAAGAAMSATSRRAVDLRQDFSPYQGKKRIAEISLRIMVLAASIFLCAVALNHTMNMLHVKSDAAKVEERTREDYSSAMKGKEMSSKAAVLVLKGEVSKLRKIRSGEDSGDDNSIASRLRYVLEAINSTPLDSNLKIDSITITEGLMRLDGSTNSRANTQKLLSAIDAHKKLKRAQESLQQSGAVDSFSVNIELAR